MQIKTTAICQKWTPLSLLAPQFNMEWSFFWTVNQVIYWSRTKTSYFNIVHINQYYWILLFYNMDNSNVRRRGFRGGGRRTNHSRHRIALRLNKDVSINYCETWQFRFHVLWHMHPGKFKMWQTYYTFYENVGQNEQQQILHGTRFILKDAKVNISGNKIKIHHVTERVI